MKSAQKEARKKLAQEILDAVKEGDRKTCRHWHLCPSGYVPGVKLTIEEARTLINTGFLTTIIVSITKLRQWADE